MNCKKLSKKRKEVMDEQSGELKEEEVMDEATHSSIVFETQCRNGW